MALINLHIEDNVSAGFVDIEKAKGVIARNTLNTIAFLVRKNDIKNIKSEFINRNKYTIGSVRVEKAIGKNINTMQSRTYYARENVEQYMALHEEGGIKKPKRGKRLAMPQLGARSGVKSKLVNRQLYLKNIKKRTLKWNTKSGTRKSRTVAMAYMANKNNMFMQYSKNIYKISSFLKTKNKIRFKKIHLYNVSEKTARIKKRPHFQPALKQPIRDAQNIFESQTRKLLRKKYII